MTTPTPTADLGRRHPTPSSTKGVERPNIGGVTVREADIEPVKGLRSIAILFRGMAILLLLLMVMQVISAVTGAVPISYGVVGAEAVRLIIFAGLLWGAGDLAVLFVMSHYDLRASRILQARMEYLMRHAIEAQGGLPPADPGPRAGRDR